MSASALPLPAREPAKPGPVLERLWTLHPKVIDLSLERIERLLRALGNPERRMAPVVHVAGTNGKGSVVAFLRAMCEAAGHRVHVYTSPHLVRFNERIRISGALVSDDELYDVLSECEAANGGAPITFFEITTAAAFLAFARHPADIVLMETGMGGRLDATNVLARPACTGIMPISLDHMQFLGETIAKIAFEKAGILKRGVAAVIAAQVPEAAQTIAARAKELGVPLFRSGAEWTARALDDGMAFRDAARDLKLPRPALAGMHQIQNAGAALAFLPHLPVAVGTDAIATGLRSVEWPARLQRLTRGPLIESLARHGGAGSELWLDGGHNPGAGEVLGETARRWDDLPLRLVFGMLNTKDGVGFLRPLAPYVESVRAVAVPGEEASLSAEEAAERARQAGHRCEPAASLAQAVEELAAPGPRRILICGSLYLAGTVLSENG
jgi:dihydrofolate synthase/folylpolyglutamate synthase